ncbi:MAG TPA: carboxypeptidase regulatory-like domain-containing protein [Longimicrobiaceae bacterium]|nr:carboxypeptidase regulatory-like domain-containing protein [Longimicrobiaceae bacterium]
MRATLAAALAATLLLCRLPAAAQEPAAVTVRGSVADSRSGAPIVGARVGVPALRTFVASDSTGRFAIRLPAGAHVFTFDRLGYARLTEEVELAEGDRLDVVLLPRSVLLEAITVSADKLAERRSRVPVASLAATHEDIAIAGYSNAGQAAMLRFNFESCPGTLRDSCVLVRGRRQRIVVYVNEVRAFGGVEQLRGIPPGDVYMLEWYPSTPMLRVYTVNYIEALAAGKRSLRTIDLVDW